MHEKTLLKIALVCGVVGLLVLYIWQSNLEIEEIKISELINNKQVGKEVKVIGTVESIRDYGKIVELKVSQPAEVSVVLFKDHDFVIPRDAEVEIRGEVKEYKGKLEIVASEIKIT